MRKVPTILPREQKPLDERGGVERNESIDALPREDSERNPGTSQRSEEIRPDIEYQGLKIDLSPLEWVIVGIIAVVLMYLTR